MRQLSEKQIEVLKKHQLKKGETLNREGRSSPNRITQDTKHLLALATQKLQPAFEKALSTLLESENEGTRGRATELYLRFLEFSQPRLSAMAVKAEASGSSVIVLGMPKELELPAQSEDVQDVLTTEETNNTEDVSHDEV